MRTQRGMALLLVLWAQALLTVLLGALVVDVRQQMRLAGWQRDQIKATLAAEAGLNLAVQALSDPVMKRRWLADGRAQTLSFDGARLEIQVRSERGKLDLNTAPAKDFARLLSALGASAGQAQTFAKALDQRRSEDQMPLRVLEELRDLPAMDAPLYHAALAELTVWSGMETPDPAFATPAIQRALRLPHIRPEGADPGQALTVHVRVRLNNGFSTELDSTVVLTSATRGVRPFRVVRYTP